MDTRFIKTKKAREQTFHMAPSSPTKGAFDYIKDSKVAMVCLVGFILIVLGAICIPMFSSFTYSQQNVAFSNQPMFSTDPINGAIHYFGTDSLGRDIFVRCWYGARISLIIAISVACIDCFIGVVYGGISGILGGHIDTIMMRIIDILGAIPYLIILLLLMSVLPRGLLTIIIAYSLTGWTMIARLVRGQVVMLKKQDFMIASTAMGATTFYKIKCHLLPNMLHIIIINITLDIPNIIFTEAFLSLLGLGIAPPQPSWGILVNQGIKVFQIYPMQLFIPSLFICMTTLMFHIFGEKLSEAFLPRMRR